MNKQLTSKSFGKYAYNKNQFNSQSNKLPTNYKSATSNMIKHATNQTHHRFELESGDITAGRQSYELFMERVKSKQLSELVNNQLTKPWPFCFNRLMLLGIQPGRETDRFRCR